MTKGRVTEFGFTMGPLTVERACSDDKKGWVIVMLKTPKYPNGIEVYVTKTGKVRIHSKRGEEWKPDVR